MCWSEMMKWIFFAFAGTVVCGCPKNVTKRVRECMGPLEMYAAEDLISRMDKTMQLCEDGKIQVAFSCLSDLYNSCAGPPESMRRLGLMVDARKWSAVMNNICTNMEYLRNNSECERRASQEYMPCAEAEIAHIGQKLFAKWADLSDPQVVDESKKLEIVTKITCYFSMKILDCLRIPFEKYCPRPMTNLMVSTIENFMPSACGKGTALDSKRKSQSLSYQVLGYDDMIANSKGTTTRGPNVVLEVITQSSKTKGKNGKNGGIESSKSSARFGNKGSKVKAINSSVLFILNALVLSLKM